MASDSAKVMPIRAEPANELSQSPSLAERLLRIEADVRSLSRESELVFHIVNETRRVVAFRQSFLITNPETPRVKAISSISVVDPNALLVRWVESMVRALVKENGSDKIIEFTQPAYSETDQVQSADYPFPCLVWVPLPDRNGKAFSGLLLAREKPWCEVEISLAKRLGETYAHAWLALSGRGMTVRAKSNVWLRRLWLLALAGAVGAGLIPVPLRTLAPVEVVADGTSVVVSPLRGVIDTIEVPPNTMVKSGQVLFRLVDTELRNDFEISEQALLVAQAEVRKATQTSFVDPRAKRDLAVAAAELALAQAKRDYARELLNRTVVVARSAGIAIFGDADDWSGRPVTTGERVMEIADPSRVKLRVELAVDDAIALSESARIRVFLDADPLNAIEAKMMSASFYAEPTPDGRLAYRVDARFVDDAAPRIGLRGTAQLYGDRVPLYFYLLRRPISAVRQSLGL
jgi:multidrug resistance efflux pump